MKPVSPQQYFMGLQDILERIGDTNEGVSDYYEKLSEHLKNNTLADLSDAEYKDIYAEFADAVDKYKQMEVDIQKLPVPVKLIGMNTNLVKYFKHYVEGTQMMLDSLNPTQKEVNLEQFNQSDEIQSEMITRFQVTFSKMIGTQHVH
ncbi:MAG: hypothetical protein LBM27_02930 [Lactobacillaceae bacterium]|jgi:hypothetical protein|nr:hypothetical protein [Lactobacillaceae bacterium]